MMKRLAASTIISFTLLLPIGFATAQETVTIDGVEVTRVVIAPPHDELGNSIRAGLAASYAATRPQTRAYANAQKLYYFYGARHFEPLWLETGPAGEVVYSSAALNIMADFENSHLEGLRPADYLTKDLVLDVAAAGPAGYAGIETAFSAAALRYAQHIAGGRIHPRQVSSSIDLHPRRIDPAATLLELASSQDPGGILTALNPVHREFLALKAALARFYNGTAEEQITIPQGKMLRPGMRDQRVPLLRVRLDVAADGGGAATAGDEIAADGNGVTANDGENEAAANDDDDGTLYDGTLVAAVERFQGELGLVTDGIVGPATIAALNGGAAASKADIIANMERWRWMPSELGRFRVMVNIPQFRLAVMRGETVTHTTRVVVGKTKHKTPVFSDEIEHIVVNPYWNVPSSIARNEIMPRVVGNPGYLAARNYELLSGGRVINASAVDWSTANPNTFRIRQRPGAGNALGTIKFLFPNSHNVYLHDTPSKSLFSRSYRAYSHGCVRVKNPMDFADALLANEPKLSAASLRSMRGRSERWVNVPTHIPVHLTYFTLRVGTDGTIRSYGDIYGHNKRLIALLDE